MNAVRSLYDGLERWVESNGRRLGPVIYTIFILFLWLPIIVVAILSFSASESILQFPPDEWGLQWYLELPQNDRLVDATITSFQVSLVAVPLSVLNATVLAYVLERHFFRGKSFVWLLVLLPLVVPLVVVGTALIQFLNLIGLGTGFTAIVIAHTVRCMPYAVIVILPAFMALDKQLEEASMDLGANRFQTFFKVTLPNVYPGIIAGSFLAFAISFNEFVYTYFVRDTTTVTLPVYIWNQIRTGLTPIVNAISVLFIFFAIFIVLGAVMFTSIDRVATRRE